MDNEKVRNGYVLFLAISGSLTVVTVSVWEIPPDHITIWLQLRQPIKKKRNEKQTPKQPSIPSA